MKLVAAATTYTVAAITADAIAFFIDPMVYAPYVLKSVEKFVI